jgi:hypothetical protein
MSLSSYDELIHTGRNWKMLYEHAWRTADRKSTEVRSAADLMSALETPGMLDLYIDGVLHSVPTLHLRPGQTLRAAGGGAELQFLPGCDGVCLSRDNALVGLSLRAGAAQRAVFNDEQVPDLGRLCLLALRVSGQVQILARGAGRAGHVDVDGLDIEAADTRARYDRPRGCGVEVLQGAFTLWNQHSDANSVISARLKGLSAGRAGAPVIGSGVLVSGGGLQGGRIVVTLLQTGAVHSQGRIEPGAAGQLGGGVFTSLGAIVALVGSEGAVMTCGANDMMFDHAGAVNDRIAEAPFSL